MVQDSYDLRSGILGLLFIGNEPDTRFLNELRACIDSSACGLIYSSVPRSTYFSGANGKSAMLSFDALDVGADSVIPS
jgi:hypothetical protein